MKCMTALGFLRLSGIMNYKFIKYRIAVENCDHRVFKEFNIVQFPAGQLVQLVQFPAGQLVQ